MSLIIPINDKWRFELDKYSWAVAKYSPRNDKRKKQWEQISWHKTLAQAAESLREQLLFDSDAYGVDEVLQALSDSTRLLTDAIKTSGIPDSWLNAKKMEDGLK